MVLSEPLTETPSETPNWNPLLNLGPWASLFPRLIRVARTASELLADRLASSPWLQKPMAFRELGAGFHPGPAGFAGFGWTQGPKTGRAQTGTWTGPPNLAALWLAGYTFSHTLGFVGGWIVQPWDDDCQGLFQMEWNNQSILELFILPFLLAYTVYHIVQYTWAWVKV